MFKKDLLKLLGGKLFQTEDQFRNKFPHRKLGHDFSSPIEPYFSNDPLSFQIESCSLIERINHGFEQQK